MTNARSLHIRDAKLGNLVLPTHPDDEDYDANLTEDQATKDGDTCVEDDDDSVVEIDDSALLVANVSVVTNDDASSEETLSSPARPGPAQRWPRVYTRRRICPFPPTTADDDLPPPGFEFTAQPHFPPAPSPLTYDFLDASCLWLWLDNDALPSVALFPRVSAMALTITTLTRPNHADVTYCYIR